MNTSCANPIRVFWLFLLSAPGFWPATALGLGVRIPNQDATAIGRGNAFVATADNPSAIYYNPAGITQLKGHNVQAGSLFYLNVYTDYETPAGQGISNDPEIIPVPQLHYVFTPEKLPLSFGLGVYAPYGLSMKWPDNAPFNDAGIESKLTYITLNPVLAWQMHPTLSVAAGPTFNYSEITLRRGTGAFGVPGGQFEFKGDNFGYGYNVGLRWQPHEKWALGTTYRSATTVNYEGTTELTFAPPPLSSSSELEYPQSVAAGISFRPTPKWNLEVNVDWTDWTSFDQLEIVNSLNLPGEPLDWKSSFFYEAGVTRYLGKAYYLSAGYFFSEESTRTKTFTPLVPDTDLHVGSLGGGYRGTKWSWALSGQIIAGPWRTIPDANAAAVNGRYRLFTPTVSLSVGYRF